jgi:O-acetyl-ADP-ribose deacetylase (regulator of RNase III)
VATQRSFGDVVVECVQGDIAEQPDVDAVVNAANADLAPGAGVAGAIHRKAGPGLYEECRALAPIRTGEAVITGGHGLPNPWCIHVLGPVYARSSDAARELASCYREALRLADSKRLASLASPAVSTGVFGYPVDEAAAVALRAVASAAGELETVRLVRFVLWDGTDYDVHKQVLEAMT